MNEYDQIMLEKKNRIMNMMCEYLYALQYPISDSFLISSYWFDNLDFSIREAKREWGKKKHQHAENEK